MTTSFGSGHFQPSAPKPYDFVPLPEQQPPLQPPAGHHRYRAEALSGVLEALITALSPVHVASGLLEQQPSNKQYPLVKAHFRTGGTPAIPGTSLKGCIRSIVEAITPSAVTITRSHERASQYLPPRSIDKHGLDLSGRIFGALGYLGSVNFADAALQGQVEIIPSPQLFRPRYTYFDENRRARGRKFYMHGNLAKGNLPLEACAAGSTFRLRMTFNNLTKEELGVILIALGLGQPSFCPKLGGGKPACLGTIEISQPVLQCDNPKARYSGDDAAAATPTIDELIAAGSKLVLQPQLTKLADILRCPRKDRDCPKGSY
ncbi:RAMP superfamily CRISPR-associated protein [Chloroflexus sp.]|uniref:RAMP superfamily CRISPR-associated protein n=1 Tax=Chloroflexus sp. TaxID=1904827 RepID=UPI002ACE41E0|nr:RAMP superfamily CRISPR-associated protein [Chloroflexus sp.]